MITGFFPAQRPNCHLLFDPGMVFGYLVQLTGPQEVGPAIPDVGDVESIFLDDHYRAGGPHPSLVCILARLVDSGVDVLEHSTKDFQVLLPSDVGRTNGAAHQFDNPVHGPYCWLLLLQRDRPCRRPLR